MEEGLYMEVMAWRRDCIWKLLHGKGTVYGNDCME